MAKKKRKKDEGKATSKKARSQSGETRGPETGGKEGQRQWSPAKGVVKAVRPGRQGAHGRANSRFHPCAIGPDLHAAFGVAWRRCDQGRASRRRRYHARPAGRCEGRGLALLHDAQPQQALDHHRLQASAGHARAQCADQEVRRAGGEFRAWRARPHGPDLGLHPQAQPAHDRRFGQGLRPRSLRGLQGL